MTSPRTENKNDEIDLLELGKELFRKKWIIIAVVIICAAIGYLGSAFLITPTYSSSFKAYVNNHNTSETLTTVSSSDTSARTSLADTAADIAKSNTVFNELESTFGIDKKKITINTGVDSSSGILSVSVIITDREQVQAVAEELERILKEETERIIEGSSLQIIDTPEYPEGKYSPSNTKNALIAALIGLVVVCIIVIIRYMLDDKLKDLSVFEKEYGIHLVGTIPDLANSAKGHGYYGDYYSYGYASHGAGDKRMSREHVMKKQAEMNSRSEQSNSAKPAQEKAKVRMVKEVED